jgi:hypothetical protein
LAVGALGSGEEGPTDLWRHFLQIAQEVRRWARALLLPSSRSLSFLRITALSWVFFLSPALTVSQESASVETILLFEADNHDKGCGYGHRFTYP